jgi:hypothetical protein
MKRAVFMLAGLGLLAHAAAPVRAGTFNAVYENSFSTGPSSATYNDFATTGNPTTPNPSNAAAFLASETAAAAAFTTAYQGNGLHQLWQDNFNEYSTNPGNITLNNPAPLFNSSSLPAGVITNDGNKTLGNPTGIPTTGQVGQIAGASSINKTNNSGLPAPEFLLNSNPGISPLLTISGLSGNPLGVNAISLNFGYNGPTAATGKWTVTLSGGGTVVSGNYDEGSSSETPYFFGYIAPSGQTITQIVFTPSVAGGSQYVAIDNITTYTPEPASMTLLAIGGLGMAGYGWRRRKQAATA